MERDHMMEALEGVRIRWEEVQEKTWVVMEEVCKGDQVVSFRLLIHPEEEV